MRKRGNNEGSVYRRKDGRWVGAVTLGYTPSGSPKRRVVYGSTRAEAAQKLTELLDRYNKGLLAEPDTVTLRQFAEGWLERETAGKSRSTRRNYGAEIEHVLRFLGDMKLQAIKPIHVRGMLDRMAREGWTPKPHKRNPNPEPRPYTARTIKKALERLRAILQDAVRLEVVYRNPCDGIRVKAPPSEPVGRVLEPQELAALLRECEAHPLGLFFKLVLDCGLRKGEALALTWADIDLEANPARLSVSKAWTGNGKQGHLTQPKTRGSRRVVPIPPSTAQALRALREATVKAIGPNIGGVYVFSSPFANRPLESCAPNHALRRMCERAGIRPLRVHDLRHSYGSHLLAAGVPLEVVSARMGHANPTITLNVYRHLLKREHTGYLFSVTDTVAHLEPPQPLAAPLPN